VAKKTDALNDRRAVIDDIRKKQSAAERRRGFVIIGPLLLVAVLIVGAAAWTPVKDWWDERQYDDVTLASIGGPASDCQEPATSPSEGQEHVATNTPVTYTSVPPVTGNHWNEAGVAPVGMEKKFYTADDRPPLEALIHNSEHGYTIVWYDETAAKDSSTIDELRAIAGKFPGDENMRYKMKVVPWTSEDGEDFPEGQHIAYTHWSAGGEGETDTTKQLGVVQMCSGVSGEALKTFMETYPYTDSPEPNAM
jgi:hypothetical protein